MAATNIKDPEAVLDYGFDWSSWLVDDDLISGAVWTVPDGLTEESSSVVSGTVTKIWLSGGTAGAAYSCTVHVTTPAGREDDRTIIIKCVDR